MKLSKLFHTLYATVMALPVLIIPIFALNILHKETEPISIEVQEKISVNFNQQIDYDTIRYGSDGGYSVKENNAIKFTNNQQRNGAGIYVYANFILNHKYYVQFTINSSASNFEITTRLGVNTPAEPITYTTPNSDLIYTALSTFTRDSGSQVIEFDLALISIDLNNTFNYSNIMFTDLTTMYGEGNEPTLEEYINTFNGTYYPYTTSEKMLVNKLTTTTFNSTDIGSQFLYSLYKPVNDYFNFGEFFGLGGMYDWFQLNIFNGTSPLSFFIVFNVMIYWLFISLFWLLFDILIYVPMVIHKWLDKAEM